MGRCLSVVLLGMFLGSACMAEARELVSLPEGAEAGTIIVSTKERQLYLARGDGTAWRYRVAVGRPGKQWFGESAVSAKYVAPAWSPPDEVWRDNPRLPAVIPGGTPQNPMGARAMTLSGGEYAIHGTNRPSSIGTYASYGCIRMLNSDIIDLYDHVQVGARVVVR
jgi:lipoprotein-anchoring transpeptidase ErfK/SrfK